MTPNGETVGVAGLKFPVLRIVPALSMVPPPDNNTPNNWPSTMPVRLLVSDPTPVTPSATASGYLGDDDPNALRAVPDIAVKALDQAAVDDVAAADQRDAASGLAADQTRIGDRRVRGQRLGGQVISFFVFAEEIGGCHAVGSAGDLTAVGDGRPGLGDHDPAAGSIVDAAITQAVAPNGSGVVDDETGPLSA